jgi:hypothetical protein
MSMITGKEIKTWNFVMHRQDMDGKWQVLESCDWQGFCWSTWKLCCWEVTSFQYCISATSYTWYQLCLVIFLILLWGQHWPWDSVLLIWGIWGIGVLMWRFKFSGMWWAAGSLIRAPVFWKRENCKMDIMNRDTMPVILFASNPSLSFLSRTDWNVGEWSVDLAKWSCGCHILCISY